MKSDDLRKAIGDIDDPLIEAADKMPKKKKDRTAFFKWTAAAASFIIVFAVLFTVNYSIKHRNPTGEIEPTETAPKSDVTGILSTETKAPGISTIPTYTGEELKAIDDWDTKLIYEKYISLHIYDTEYSPLGPNYGHSLNIGEKLFENARLTGQRKDEIKETTADVYALEKVLPAAMVNVHFNDGTDCIYFCRDYFPETLGDLINDLYLDVSLLAESANTPTVFDEDGKIVEEQKWYRVYNDDVLSLFKNNRNIKNGADRNGANHMENETVLLTVGIKVASYGYPFAMWLTESGYLRMNIFNKYSFFYIGSEKAKAFADSIISREAQIPATAATMTETPE